MERRSLHLGVARDVLGQCRPLSPVCFCSIMIDVYGLILCNSDLEELYRQSIWRYDCREQGFELERKGLGFQRHARHAHRFGHAEFRKIWCIAYRLRKDRIKRQKIDFGNATQNSNLSNFDSKYVASMELIECAYVSVAVELNDEHVDIDTAMDGDSSGTRETATVDNLHGDEHTSSGDETFLHPLGDSRGSGVESVSNGASVYSGDPR